MRLFPREEKFFDLLEQQASRIVEASRLLNEGVRAHPSSLAEMAGEIKHVEHEADRITHHLFTKLNQTFVTPLDPEDIHALGASLDDVLDYIEDAAFRISAYHVDPVPPGVADLTAIIHACCLRLETAIGKLRDQKNTLEDCIEINRLENSADDMCRKLVTRLFNEESDAITLIKHKEIYEVLESATDRCEDVADVLQSVIVKNS